MLTVLFAQRIQTVLLLLAFAYNKKSSSKHWFMKYETEKYAEIENVVEY